MTENLLKRNKKKKGFTLIELIVVIAIIAIISLIAIPKVMGYQADAKIKADKANAKTIANVVATEITNGDIASNTTITDIVIDTGATTDPAATSVTKVADAKYYIIKNMQSIPKIQSGTHAGGYFYVTIDSTSNVKVYDSASATGTQVYP